MTATDDELLSVFIDESSECLDSLDENILKLERTPEDRDLVQQIFRVMHTLKGTCGLFGFHRLEKLAHHAEDVLGRVRDGKLEPSPHVITPLLQTIDLVRQLIRHIVEEHREPSGVIRH